MSGPIVHIATRGEDYVEVWHIEDPDSEPVHHAFTVAGTDQPLESALATHVGTAVTPSGAHVYHVFEHEGSSAPRPGSGPAR